MSGGGYLALLIKKNTPDSKDFRIKLLVHN